MFTKTLTAGVLAASMALTSMTPNSASAEISGDDALVGFLTLLFIGAAIHESRSDDDDRAAAPVPQPRQNAGQGWRVLPAQCIRDHVRRNGNTIRVFGRHCTHSNYRFVNRLPQECLAQFRIANGEQRFGYRVRCMRNQGFRTTRH